MKSNLHNILEDQFLGPPYPISRKEGKITIIEPEHHDGKSFASLQLQKLLNIKLSNENFKSCPYDLYCPSVKLILNKSYCKKCSLYFATQARYLTHNKNIHRVGDARNNITLKKTKQILDNDYPIMSLEKCYESPWVEE